MTTVASSVDVQHALNVLGATPPLTEDGKLGPLSQAAVKAFQAAHSLSVDGVAGPQTKAALGAALDMQGGVAAPPPAPGAPRPAVVAIHTPPVPSAGIAASTVHVNTVTGAASAKPFGTPAPKSAPMSTSAKAGIAALIAGAIVVAMRTLK